jgi:hypothetical protein
MARPDDTPLLDEKIRAIADAFRAAGIDHAFGGAIALAYWATPRGTEDIDVNVFVGFDGASRVLDVLAALGAETESCVRNDPGRQLVVGWGHTPLHLFFAYDPFHARCAERRRRVPFAGGEIEVLSPEDIALFKVVFDRPRDRAEVRELLVCMGERFDLDYALSWLERLLGAGDDRLVRFRQAAHELLGTRAGPA